MKIALLKLSVIIFCWCFIIASSNVFAQTPVTPAASSQDLITCGWDEVSAIRIEGSNVTTLWTWKAVNSNLPERCKPLFSTTDECKPYADGKVLVTSSGGYSLDGAVALIFPNAPTSSNVVFYTRAPNAHSADLLPGNRVAVAMSYHPNGNRLAVFDLDQSDVELLSVPLHGAHGVVWDEKRQVLWGLADTYIRRYQLRDWNGNPQLSLISTTPLPEIGGHDMYPVANTPELTVSTGNHCWLFNRDTLTFVKHPLLGDITNVKGIDTHPLTGRIVYVRGHINWWSDTLRFVSPELNQQFPGARFYKARWIRPTLAISGIDSGGGMASGESFLNHSSIGAPWATTISSACATRNRPGLIEVIYPDFIPTTTGGGQVTLPDEWQMHYFEMLGVDPLADFDSDGTRNLQEYLAGTHPKDPGSVFRPQHSYSGGLFQMSIPTVSGRDYQIWVSRDLNDWTHHETLCGDGSSQLFEFNEATITAGPLYSSSHPSKYFRIKIIIPSNL
jgi:hypothetical protein